MEPYILVKNPKNSIKINAHCSQGTSNISNSRLIKEISERHINKKLSDRFGRHFKVDTYVIVPESREYGRLEEKND